MAEAAAAGDPVAVEADGVLPASAGSVVVACDAGACSGAGCEPDGSEEPDGCEDWAGWEGCSFCDGGGAVAPLLAGEA